MRARGRDACTAVEEANWVDLATGERSMSTGHGFTESHCLQEQYALQPDCFAYPPRVHLARRVHGRSRTVADVWILFDWQSPGTSGS